MEKRYPLLLPLLAMLLLAAGCRPTPRLVQYPQGLVDGRTFLDFTFSTDLGDPKRVGQWVDTPYLSFEPAIEGMFSWKDTRTLRFQARQSLPEATAYTVTLGEGFPQGTGITLPPIAFHTTPFALISSDVTWRDESYYGNRLVPVTATLRFNMDVNPDELRQHLTIYANDTLISNYDINAWMETSAPEIAIDLGMAVDAPVLFRFELKAGFAPHSDQTPLPRDTSFTATLMPLSVLDVVDWSTSDEEDGNAVRIRFNQPVEAEAAAKHLQIVPEVPFLVRREGSTVLVTGDFKGGKTYGVRLQKGLKGLGGGTLPETRGSSVTIPAPEPILRFTDYEGAYMLRNGLENFRVTSASIEEYIVKVYEIYENNLVHFLDDNWELARRDYYGSESSYYDGWSYGADIDDWGRLIYSDTITPGAPDDRGMATTVIHLKKKLRSKFRGVFVVELEKPDSYYGTDAKLVSVSDLGIVARRFDNEMLVFVNSLGNAQPVPGAQVQLISETNQPMLSATTDGSGVARFPNLRALGPGFDERLVYVSHGGDYNFLDLERTQIETSRFELSGKSVREWDAYAWSERNLYRPGDTAHLACLIRNWDYQAQDGMPVLATLRTPSGEARDPLRFLTGNGGAIAFDLPLSASEMTGTYAIDFSLPTGAHLTTLEFHVEDFLPDKIRVSPRAQQPEYFRGDTARLIVDAEYYFGAPCDSHICESRFSFSLGAYHSRQYPDYTFHTPRGTAPEGTEGLSHLNAQGQDTIELPIPDAWRYYGPLYANGYAIVHDNTGRTVTRKAPFTIHTQRQYIGIRKANAYYLSMGDAATFDILAVDPLTDRPADSFPLVVTVYKRMWHNTVRHTSQRYIIESNDVGQVLRADTLLQQGRPIRFSHKLSDPGVYVIKVARPGEAAEHLNEYLVYGKGAEYASTFSTNREGTVHIRTNQDQYTVGGSARIHFATPFSGRMLVTLERDRVLRHMYVDVPRNSAEVSIPITDDMVPNVVVSATLFHPMRGRTPLPFTVSHGYHSIKVDNQHHDMPVAIEVPERAYPGKRAFATVRTAPGAQLIVATVDEGILAIKNFKTPDPYPYFYAAREHRVEAFDMYQFLLPEVLKAGPATGGDMSGGYSGLNPFQIRRFRPLALWSGIVRANGAGIARVPLDLHPGFNGKVRVMAVAWSGRRFGSADNALKVHEDLVVQAGIPRLLTAGDSVHLPVHVMNTTDKVQEATLHLELEGPLKAEGPITMPVKVLGKGTHKGGFSIRALPALGKCKIRLRLEQGKKITLQETPIAVRAAGQMERTKGHGHLDPGQQRTITFPAGFHPETQAFRLRVSNFPAMQHSAHLRDLILYPHGCTEQIVSKLFPQLYLPDLAQMAAPEAFEGSNTIVHVNEGIRKVLERQTYNGGFAFWDGDGADDWLTVYAVHFLLEARKAGFIISENALRQGMTRVHEIAQQDGLQDYWHNAGSGWVSSQIAKKERAYALYVCALAGEPETALMLYYKAHPKELSGDETYLLAAAFALANDPASFQALLPKAWKPEAARREHGGTLDSELRPSAITLSALCSADPGHPYVPLIVEYLIRNADRAYATQDKAWIMMSLGKAAQAQRAESLRIVLTHKGTLLQSGDAKGFHHFSRDLAGQSVLLATSGTGRAYYAWEAEGVPIGTQLKPRKPSHRIRVTRSYHTPQGEQIIKPYFLQGELVVCKVKLSADTAISHVAITDLIAAGMEVENQRLSSTDYPWVKMPAQTLDAQDVRDGGLVTYTSLPAKGPQEFCYLLRPVNPGRFSVPPIFAEAMYDTRMLGHDAGFEAMVLPAGATLPVRTAPKRAIAASEETRMMQWWRHNLQKARKA